MSGTLIILPIALTKLPVEEASVWLLFSTVLALQTLFLFGFSPTFIRAIAYANADKISENKHATVYGTGTKMAAVITTMRVIYRRILIAATLFFGLIGTVSVAGPIASTGSIYEGWIAWVIIAIGALISIYGNIYSNILEGSENVPILRRWGVVIGTLNTCACVTALYMGYGLLGLAIANQIGSIGQVLVNRRLAKALTPTAAWDKVPRVDAPIFEAVWPAAWRSGVGIAMSLGIFQASGLIYAQLAEPAEVAAYLLALRLVQTNMTFANVPLYSALPTLARLYRNNERPELFRIARTQMTIAIWIYTSIVLIIGFFANIVMDAIGSNANIVEPKVWWMLGIAFLVERIGAMNIQIYSISNKIIWHLVNGVTGTLMIPLMYFMYYQYGIIGFPAAIFLSYTIFYLPYSLYQLKLHFGLSFRQLDVGHATIPMAALISILVYTFIRT